jgi:hypothetical protein
LQETKSLYDNEIREKESQLASKVEEALKLAKDLEDEKTKGAEELEILQLEMEEVKEQKEMLISQIAQQA